jgi:hypothetical protein
MVCETLFSVYHAQCCTAMRRTASLFIQMVRRILPIGRSLFALTDQRRFNCWGVQVVTRERRLADRDHALPGLDNLT